MKDFKKATFGDIFNIPVPANKIFTKTLQVNVWSKSEDQREKCVVSLDKIWGVVGIADIFMQYFILGLYTS